NRPSQVMVVLRSGGRGLWLHGVRGIGGPATTTLLPADRSVLSVVPLSDRGAAPAEVLRGRCRGAEFRPCGDPAADRRALAVTADQGARTCPPRAAVPTRPPHRRPYPD